MAMAYRATPIRGGPRGRAEALADEKRLAGEEIPNPGPIPTKCLAAVSPSGQGRPGVGMVTGQKRLAALCASRAPCKA